MNDGGIVKVAVQGASGFVGSRLVERLHLGALAEVVPIVRSYSALTRVARFDIGWKLADGLDEGALTDAFAGCDVVIMSVTGSEQLILGSPAATIRAAERAGVRRVVYLSTAVALGFHPGADTDDETPPVVDQPWVYNRSKARAETSIDALRRETGVEVVVLRPSIVYGPRSDSWTIAAAQRLLWHTAFLVDGGRNICNAIYVDNLVDAAWLAATVPAAADQQFFVSDRERVTWADLYRSLSDAVGVPFSEIHDISREEVRAHVAASAGLASTLKGQLKSDRGKRVVARIPSSTKQRVRRLQRAWTVPGEPVAPGPRDFLWSLPDVEYLVQICDTQLPIAKAERILGYDPLPFSEGARRSGAWLAAMGFQAHLDR